jgi:MFS superfamily sulfate permease-like transporter
MFSYYFNLVLVLCGVTLLSKFFDWNTKLDLNIIGKIPQGLPHFGFFSLSWGLSKRSPS